MKKALILLLLLGGAQNFYAQNYQINFAGSGASTSVDSVKIENLTQCTSMSIGGADILNLTSTITGINELNNSNSIQVYPNPSCGNFSVDLSITAENNAVIQLFDMTGKLVLQDKVVLAKGLHKIQLKDIPGGLYSLHVVSDTYEYSAKVISNSQVKNNTSHGYIERIENNDRQSNNLKLEEANTAKGTFSIIDMQFNAGDTIKLTGKSGIYKTIKMLFPSNSQTMTFDFVDCTDANGNHYAVVQIGSQLWMAENLKATKYRDGSTITNVQDSATWGSTTTGAWCDFLNNPAEGAYYGHLYNWYAASDSRNIAPLGWHVATNPDWNKMEKFVDNTVDTTFLGGTGAEIGRMLKEGCNTRWQFYDSTAGWNSIGFSALCSNFRNSSGAWSLAPNNNHDDSFWTATSYSTSMAWNKSFRWCTRDIYSLFNFNRAGSSIRCIKDIP